MADDLSTYLFLCSYVLMWCFSQTEFYISRFISEILWCMHTTMLIRTLQTGTRLILKNTYATCVWHAYLTWIWMWLHDRSVCFIGGVSLTWITWYLSWNCTSPYILLQYNLSANVWMKSVWCIISSLTFIARFIKCNTRKILFQRLLVVVAIQIS